MKKSFSFKLVEVGNEIDVEGTLKHCRECFEQMISEYRIDLQVMRKERLEENKTDEVWSRVDLGIEYYFANVGSPVSLNDLSGWLGDKLQIGFAEFPDFKEHVNQCVRENSTLEICRGRAGGIRKK